MEKSKDNVKVLYGRYPFGDFEYDRSKYNPLLKDFLKLRKKGNILYDIGCGNGYWFRIYSLYGFTKNKIRGVDLSRKSVEHLNRLGYRVIEGNVLGLNLTHNVSDMTVCDGVIHHTADPSKSFRELVRITKPNGHIYINVYNKFHPYHYIVYWAAWPLRYAYWNINKKAVVPFQDMAVPILKFVLFLLTRKVVTSKTARTIFMDQVITPYAHLFTKNELINLAKRNGCKVMSLKYNKYYSMISAILKVQKSSFPEVSHRQSIKE